jgi:hypothetical protein
MLVGAVALAFVVLGLTAVYTAQLSARPASTGTAGVDAQNAVEFDRESRRNVRSVVVRANHADANYSDRAAANASAAEGVANYSALVGETYAARSGVVASVAYERTETYGTRTVTRSNNTSFGAGGPDWYPVRRPSAVGWAVLNLNISAMERGDSFAVVVESGDDADATPGTPEDDANETRYEFSRNASGATVLDVTVSTETGELPRSTTCNPRGQRSLLDLRDGTVFTSGCTFGPGLQSYEGPYTIRIERGGRAVGGFEFVTDATPPPATSWAANGRPACTDPGVGLGDPCNTYAVWNATVTTSYYTDRLSYDHTQNVSVYEEV